MPNVTVVPLQSKSADGDLAGLLGRVGHKDKAAFEALYRVTAAKLYGVVFRILRQKQPAEDVLQEVYVKIWDHAADFDATRAAPMSWLATIARNRALDQVRRRQHASLGDLPEGFEMADDAPLALDLLVAGDDGRQLGDCLDRLEPQKREMIVKAYLDGTSREELATRYAVPVPTIKTWLRRSLAQLRTCLDT